MKHLYKVNIPNNPVDLFFSALDSNNNVLTFMAISKDGEAILDPATNSKERTVEFTINDGHIMAVDGGFVLPIIHLQKMNEYFNLN
jgi:hypothetical protein